MALACRSEDALEILKMVAKSTELSTVLSASGGCRRPGTAIHHCLTHCPGDDAHLTRLLNALPSAAKPKDAERRRAALDAPHAAGGETALALALRTGQVDAFARLIAAGADPLVPSLVDMGAEFAVAASGNFTTASSAGDGAQQIIAASCGDGVEQGRTAGEGAAAGGYDMRLRGETRMSTPMHELLRLLHGKLCHEAGLSEEEGELQRASMSYNAQLPSLQMAVLLSSEEVLLWSETVQSALGVDGSAKGRLEKAVDGEGAF